MKKKEIIKTRISDYKNQFKEVIRDLKNKETRKKQIPNLITLSRGVAVLAIAPIAISGNFLLAAIITAVSGLTDAIDGKLARKLNATSEFGKYSDAIVDKLFACSLLVTIACKIDIAYFVPLLMELGIGTVNVLIELNDERVSSSLVGKAKTWVLFSTIALNYLAVYFKVPVELLSSFFTLTVAAQTVTLGSYINKLPNDKKNESIVENNQNHLEKDNQMIEEKESEEILEVKIKTNSEIKDEYLALKKSLVSDSEPEREHSKTYINKIER